MPLRDHFRAPGSTADRHPESPVNPAITLRDATVQDIQLELIRRTRFNDFNGEHVSELLMKHRGL